MQKLKTKIFKNEHLAELEEELNVFLKELGHMEVKTIKYNTYSVNDWGSIKPMHSCIILYVSKEEK